MPRPRRFYQIEGTLSADVPSYVKRVADEELYSHVRQGKICYVLTTRQMGKSSLMIRTAGLLKAEGTLVAIVDLTGIASDENSVTADQWYFGIGETILDDLGLDTDLYTWWDERAKLPPLLRLIRLLRDIVLARTSVPVVIFVDEIDSTLGLPFASDFFAAIRACYNARARDPEFQRLTFVLLGTAKPSDLIADPKRTPFNIGTRVELSDFRRHEASPLAEGLGGETAAREEAIDRVLFWTDGHPYLTQKVCMRAAETSCGDISPEYVEQIIKSEFFVAGADRSEDNLSFVRNRVADRGAMTTRLLRLYTRVLQGKPVKYKPTSATHNELNLAGLVKVRDDGRLVVRNRIYEKVFGRSWIREVWPPANPWMRVAVVASVLLLLCPVFWYEVIYPRQIIPTLEKANVGGEKLAKAAYEQLVKIPFYHKRADDLWEGYIRRTFERRAVVSAFAERRDEAILWWLKAQMSLPGERGSSDQGRSINRLRLQPTSENDSHRCTTARGGQEVRSRRFPRGRQHVPIIHGPEPGWPLACGPS